jgi:hypothetical protein
MRSNAGIAERQGDVDLLDAKVSAPQLELWLGWLGLVSHSFIPTRKMKIAYISEKMLSLIPEILI